MRDPAQVLRHQHDVPPGRVPDQHGGVPEERSCVEHRLQPICSCAESRHGFQLSAIYFVKPNSK